MKIEKEKLKVIKTLKALYIEDEDKIRNEVKNNLESFFAKFDTAIDGFDGLNKFKTNSFDIIITDIKMPNLNGLAMIEEIRKIDKDIPIIITTAFNEIGYLEKAIEFSVDGYIYKPFKISKFLERIYKVSLKIMNKRLQQKLQIINSNLQKEIDKRVDELRCKDKIMLNQSRYAIMGEMIDAIAHQWKQPINAINLITMLLEESCSEENLEKSFCLDIANKISTQIEHLDVTLDEFRNFFREDKVKTNFDLRDMLNSVISLIKDEFQKYKIDFIINEGNFIISGFENELKHVLLNIINNSKDAFIENSIENRVIDIEIKDKNLIYIRDNAGGIKEDVIDKIFNLNFTTKKDKGTGVGLYLSKLIMDKMGGDLSVKNIKNGAEFLISIV